VSALKKRRHYSFYFSLPLVIAIVTLLVAKLAALQRADMIAELAACVANRDAPEAAAAVRKLAAIPRPPMAVLVSAASSAERPVAQEAQQSISRVLRKLQRNIEVGKRHAEVSRQLSELAQCLADERETFSTGDHAWLSGTTNKVLRLANRIPQKHTPLVAIHCDVILATVAARDVSEIELADIEPATGELYDSGDFSNDASERHARLQREFSASAAPPQRSGVVREASQAGEQIGETESHAPVEEFIKAPWRASWSYPLFRVVPGNPTSDQSTDEIAPSTSPTPSHFDDQPDEPEFLGRPMADVDSRALMRRWLTAEGPNDPRIEEELSRRGFGRLSKRLALQLISKNPEDRLRLVDDIVTTPRIDARPWLLMLAEDQDADVRLLAVTIMATSNDTVLVEKAWHVAIHDRDPRIAGLASRLRERRDGTQQR